MITPEAPLPMLVAAGVLLGLVIGSFLNVVIHRLPIMLERRWRADCLDLLSGPSRESDQPEYNLAFPASHCPNCQRSLGALENIPILSFIGQRGKCRGCGATISWRYPAVEALAGLVTGLVLLRFGPTETAAAAVVLTWILIALAAIDLEHQILPDILTLPALWAGLLLNVATESFATPSEAIIGAVAGYLLLWLVYWGFKLATGREGMGYGDFKLLAMFGAWLGWHAIPIIVLLSSLVGAVLGITLIMLKIRERKQPIPFGPFLAVAGWIAMLGWTPSLLLN